ncbi:MAG: hypothetical protein J0L93_02350 [Deltaproteobacteria bacterium]|nr:hypothetical protein [Deltaproteobacteria bacterium]
MKNRIKFLIAFLILSSVAADIFADSCPGLLSRLQSSVSEFRASRKGRVIMAGTLVNLMAASPLFKVPTEFFEGSYERQPYYLLRPSTDPLTGESVLEVFDRNDPTKRTLAHTTGSNASLIDSPRVDRE